VTDGAKFRHDVAVQVEPAYAGDGALQVAGRAFRDAVIADLRRRGSDPLPFYPSFVVNDDPASGIEDGVSTPRFSTGYFLQRNRFGMLVETHSWRDYPTRVAITHDTVLSVLRQVAAHGGDWLRLQQAADARAAQLAGLPVPLEFKASATERIVDFPGYHYTRTPSDVSGTLMTRYDESQPETWHMRLFDDVQPKVSAVAPLAGYLVPAEHAARVGALLALHGVEFRVLPAAQAGTSAWRADSATPEGKSTEGHQRLKATGSWRPEARTLGPGALYVPVAQAKSRLLMGLLEPDAPDSLLGWGEFNNDFEQKEYMEPYVAEEVAREQLAKDPALAAEFAERVRSDAAFAADPQARLDFFYRRHTSWDERYRLYPVLRTDVEPAR
jgi:hypothetical protein